MTGITLELELSRIGDVVDAIYYRDRVRDAEPRLFGAPPKHWKEVPVDGY